MGKRKLLIDNAEIKLMVEKNRDIIEAMKKLSDTVEKELIVSKTKNKINTAFESENGSIQE